MVSSLPPLCLARWCRTLFVTLLACVVLAMGTPESRVSVLFENGQARVYETEVTMGRVAEMRVSLMRLGRRPYDHPAGDDRAPRAVFTEPTRSAASPASTRASPHAPRGPPGIS